MLSQTLALPAMGNHFVGYPPLAETPQFEPLGVDGALGPARLPDTDDFDLKPS